MFSLLVVQEPQLLQRNRAMHSAILEMILIKNYEHSSEVCSDAVRLCRWFYVVFVVNRTESTRLSWFRLLMNYGQETTMHGVRYITEPNSFLCRRLRQDLVIYRIRNFNNGQKVENMLQKFLVVLYVHPPPSYSKLKMVCQLCER